MEERISKQELMKMYNVGRGTIEEWRRRFGLPMIEISSHKKYIRREDLIKWENQMKEGQCELELTNSGIS
jgi:transposase